MNLVNHVWRITAERSVNMEEQIRTLEEFAQKLSEAIESSMNAIYGVDVIAQVSPVLKTNGEQLGINVHFNDSNIAPTVYPEKVFEQYQEGFSLKEIADRMSKSVFYAHKQSPEIPDFTLEEAKKSITLTLVNTERNEQMLENTPHFEVGDLSAIPRWFISEEASFVVHNDMVAKLMLTPDEVLQIGQANIDSQQFEIKPMQEILKEMFIKDGMDPDMVDMMMPESDGPQMIVMSSQNHIQGSNSILSEDALNQVYDMLDGDYIVLPSSIHEVICVPVTEDMKPDDLRDMVHEVNMTQVASNEFLSDNIMKYDGQKLKMIMDDIKMEAPKIKVPDMDRAMHYSSIKM